MVTVVSVDRYWVGDNKCEEPSHVDRVCEVGKFYSTFPTFPSTVVRSRAVGEAAPTL